MASPRETGLQTEIKQTLFDHCLPWSGKQTLLAHWSESFICSSRYGGHSMRNPDIIAPVQVRTNFMHERIQVRINQVTCTKERNSKEKQITLDESKKKLLRVNDDTIVKFHQSMGRWKRSRVRGFGGTVQNSRNRLDCTAIDLLHFKTDKWWSSRLPSASRGWNNFQLRFYNKVEKNFSLTFKILLKVLSLIFLPISCLCFWSE